MSSATYQQQGGQYTGAGLSGTWRYMNNGKTSCEYNACTSNMLVVRIS
jgi:hypothetical protein